MAELRAAAAAAAAAPSSSASPAESPAARPSELSLDDLSAAGGSAAPSSINGASDDDGKSDSRPDRRDVEGELQRNLRQQQEHYARQRRLLADLRADSAEASAESSPVIDTHCLRHTSKFSLAWPPPNLSRGCGLQRTLRDKERDAVRRVKDKALADFKRRMAAHRHHATARPQREFLEELQQQEASNDALRRQLELLRRLQVDNNRFRLESRALRTRNEELAETAQVRARELAMLREQLDEQAARWQQDQVRLAATAQTGKKLKAVHKQLAAMRDERDKLQDTLHEALAEREQADARAQEELGDQAVEVKKLKRTIKQLRQREASLVDEAEQYKSAVESLENDVRARKAQHQELKRANAALANQLAEREAQCEATAASAAVSVDRVESELLSFRATLQDERERRERVETEREELKEQAEALARQSDERQDQIRELEGQLSELRRRVKEHKRTHREQVSELQEQLEAADADRASDAKTLASLRSQCDSLARQLAETEGQAADMKRAVGCEARGVRKSLEALRQFVEQSTRSAAQGDSERSPEPVAQQSDACEAQEAVWRAFPEFQLVQGATSALRSAVLDWANEEQRRRHSARQQTRALAAVQAKVDELEQLRQEDSHKLQEQREQRALAEQAREIAAQEKMEVLRWGQQTAQARELLEREVASCEQFITRLLRKLEAAVDEGGSDGDDDGKDRRDRRRRRAKEDGGSPQFVSRLFGVADKQVDELLGRQGTLKSEVARQTREKTEVDAALVRIKAELDAQARDAAKTLADVETLHATAIEEMQRLAREQQADAESEKNAIQERLARVVSRAESLEASQTSLQAQVKSLEADLLPLAAVARLVARVGRPLVLQVSDLLSQKRVLVRENTELVQTVSQVRCIARVLRELLPPASVEELTEKDEARVVHTRHRKFRRVVIAVFAFNRLLLGARGSHGVCAPLSSFKVNGKSRRGGHYSALNPPSTVIKVLPDSAPLLGPILERLRALHIVEQVEAVDDASVPPEALGSLMLQVVSAIDSDADTALVSSLGGSFHCHALLQRRRTRRHGHADSDQGGGYNSEDEGTTSASAVVALVQSRIIALGKRVEDLHFQRNALQHESYELQLQVETQATALNEMAALSDQTQQLQHELRELKDDGDRRLASAQAEREEQASELLEKEQALAEARRKTKVLEGEVARCEARVGELEAAKETVELELIQAKQAAVDEETGADRLRAEIRKMGEETRSFKQAATRTHELLQRAQMRLEREVAEKSALQSSVAHLQDALDRSERERRDEARREVTRRLIDDVKTVKEAEERARAKVFQRPAAVAIADLTDDKPLERSDDSNNGSDSEESAPSPARAPASPIRSPAHGRSSPVRSPALSRASPVRSPARSRTSQVRSPSAFERAWRRLDVSSAFIDTPAAKRSTCECDRAKASVISPAASPLRVWPSPALQRARPTSVSRPATLVQPASTTKNLRAVEIDKVNAAVHDYMDRIDEKLSKVYGIPPSVVIARRGSPRRTGEDNDDDSERLAGPKQRESDSKTAHRAGGERTGSPSAKQGEPRQPLLLG